MDGPPAMDGPPVSWRAAAAARRTTLRVAVALLVGAFVGAVAVVRSVSTPEAGATPGLPMPTRLVASVGDHVVVLDARDGREVRELFHGDDGTRVGGLTAASSTGMVYFVRGSGCGLAEIASVPADGGAPADLWTGTTPRLSPDGRYLAIASDPACGAPPRVVVVDLRSETAVVVPTPAVSRAEPLAWSPDSTRLLVLTATDRAARGLLVADLSRSRGMLGDVAVTGLSTRDPVTAATFLADGSLAVALEHGTGSRVVAIDPATGTAGQRLLDLANRSVTALAGAPSGRYLLLGDVDGTGARTITRLCRWAQGDSQPTTLLTTAAPVRDAAWLATAPAPVASERHPVVGGDPAASSADDGWSA